MPIFEAAFWRAVKSGEITHTDLLDLLDGFEHSSSENPYRLGVKHPRLGGELYVYQSPSLTRLPSVYFLYEVNAHDGKLLLWNLNISS